MNDDERIDYLGNQLKDIHKKLTEGLSTFLRNASDRAERLALLRSAKLDNPTLIALYEAAERNEDFETCDVVKEFLSERGIQVSS